MRWLARAGLAARGVMYIIIGWIAVEVAFDRSSQQADRTGALHTISATPVGGVLLWLLVIGFIGMALWRLSEALYGSPGSGGHKASKRLAALGRAIIYGVIAYGVLKYALGTGRPAVQRQAVGRPDRHAAEVSGRPGPRGRDRPRPHRRRYVPGLQGMEREVPPRPELGQLRARTAASWSGSASSAA